MSKEKITVGIIEDEALIADHIAACLEDLGYEISFIEDDAKGTLKAFEKQVPDVVLVDINLHGDIDGVDLVHRINALYKLPVIYLTSNSDKATIERVKLTNPAGFIVKPYTDRDLETNIELALYQFHQASGIVVEKSGSQEEKFFFLKDQHALVKVAFLDIIYIEALNNYCSLHTPEKRFVLSMTLKVIENKIAKRGFIRVHRSFLVNLSKIDKVENKSVWIGEKEIPVSDSYKKTLMEKLNLL